MTSQFQDALTHRDQRKQQAHDVYERLSTKKSGKKNRILTYRCQRGHAVLEVYRLPEGLLVHHPPYKNSPEVNARTSSPSGRAANTTNGNDRWKARNYFLEQEPINMALKCDQLNGVLIDASIVDADLEAGTTKRIITPDMGAELPYAEVVHLNDDK